MKTLSPATRSALLIALWCGAVTAAALVGGIWLLSPELRAVLAQETRLPLAVMLLTAALLLAGAGCWWWLRPQLGLVPRLVHTLDILREVNPSYRVKAELPAAVARALNALADHYQSRLGAIESDIAEATSELATERDRLTATLSQLREAVLACSEDGRILLYNPPARQLLEGEQDSGLVGLGRSVFLLFRRSVIMHCLDRLAAEVESRGDQATARAMISTRDGRYLRAVFSPLAQGELRGFFMSLSDESDRIEQDAADSDAPPQLSDEALARVTHIRAAIESLRDFPDMPDDQRERFLAIVDDESAVLGRALQELMTHQQQREQARWPLEEMPAETLVDILRKRTRRGIGSDLGVQLDEPTLWLRADSYMLAAGVRFVATQAQDSLDAGGFRLRLLREGDHLLLDLLWAGSPVPAELWNAWEAQPVQSGHGAMPHTLAEVARQHGGESWPLRGEEAGVRWLLPCLTTPREHRSAAVTAPPRPEFYDFNLFASGQQAAALDDTPLRNLICTAFDTETTGLNPAGGDEIIAIGAIRVVRGRTLGQEIFERLVHTRRPIAPASQRIHGINAALLAGAPRADAVLPQFQRFVADTVLVGHNAAFDMSFLSRQGARCGVHIDRPVLDTLLLSAVLYPEREAHQLEAIADRLGVSVVGRHTALGDAIVTAEVFVRLIPLLEAHGIETLGQAMRAAEQTWYARLKY